MKLQHVVSVLALLAICSAASASITGASIQDDGKGGIVATGYWERPSTLRVDANQYLPTGGLAATATTDTILDPTITVDANDTNNTSFNWTDYHFVVERAGAFTLSNAGGPTNWTVNITSPTPVGDGNYIGGVDYLVGTGSPVLIGTPGDFHFDISFSGSTNYAFMVQGTATPEPATMALLSAGAIGLLIRRRRK